MEEREIFSSELAVKVVEAPQSFHVSLNSLQFSGPTVDSPVSELALAPPPATEPAPVSLPVMTSGSMEGKKKRGRPRKYGPDGKVAALSPMPISSSIPLTGNFSAWKRGRGKPLESPIKKSFMFFEAEGAGPGDGIAYSIGANFTPHILIVNDGEDVTMKIMSFSQQGCRPICILSANGTLSNVTLRQPTSYGGTLTYEGRFEILSLSGSYTPTENGITKSRSGGMSISMASPDGRVMGGGLAGLLVAAGPVQVVVASFLPGHRLEQQKQKKPRVDHVPMTAPTHIKSTSAEEIKVSLGGVKSIMTPAAFQVENIFGNGQSSRNSPSDDEAPFPERESNPNHAHGGVTY